MAGETYSQIIDNANLPIFHGWSAKSVTCSANTHLTAEIDIGQWNYIAVLMPATFDGYATIAFKGATSSGGTFSAIYQSNGNEMTQYATQNTWSVVGPASLAPFRYIKIQFGASGETASQSVAKTLYVTGK